MLVENDTFTPLVMSATGVMGRESSKFYSGLSELISEKRESIYIIVATWIRRKIIFALVKSIGMYLRGSRSVSHREKLEQSVKDDELLRKFKTFIESLKYYNSNYFKFHHLISGQPLKLSISCQKV